MKIGDRVFVRGYIDEIRKDTVIIRNAGGYFGTIPSEVITGDLPSAQPERKKGKWIDAIIADTLPVIVCDQCNTFFPLAFGASHNFCPNCGADMREEEQDE